MPRHKKTQQIAHWTLDEFLGAGGNGEVWRASSPFHGEAALKVLTRGERADSEPYRRFRDEVQILTRLGTAAPGILALIASSLPERSTTSDPAWLAMPVATPLRRALGPTPELQAVVMAIRDVARTLADLGSQGIAHRDIKPDNLFSYEGRSVVGDFGLVTYPDKEPITETGAMLGPRYYLAPEMLTDAANADGKLADVYSIAKTLWVLATGQQFPPPGEHRADTAVHLLSTWVRGPDVYYLDRLMERMTRTVPAQRASMVDVHQELDAWLARLGSPAVTSQVSLESAGARIRAFGAPQRAQRMAAEAFQELAQGTMGTARARINELASDIAQATGLPQKQGDRNDLLRNSAVEGAAEFCGAAKAMTALTMCAAEFGEPGARLVIGFAMVTDEDRRRVTLHGALLVGSGAGFPKELLRDTVDADPGGAVVANWINAFAMRGRTLLPAAVAQLGDALENARGRW